jgi:hypothetical protein
MQMVCASGLNRVHVVTIYLTLFQTDIYVTLRIINLVRQEAVMLFMWVLCIVSCRFCPCCEYIGVTHPIYTHVSFLQLTRTQHVSSKNTLQAFHLLRINII